jgi:hypothetical protein
VLWLYRISRVSETSARRPVRELVAS